MWADITEAVLYVVKVEIMYLCSKQKLALSIDLNFSGQRFGLNIHNGASSARRVTKKKKIMCILKTEITYFFNQAF